MSDGYARFVRSGWGSMVAKALGLPVPPSLRRFDRPRHLGAIGLCGPENSVVYQQLRQIIQDLDADLVDLPYTSSVADGSVSTPLDKQSLHALVLDASEIESVEDLDLLHRFFSQHIRSLSAAGRVIVLGRTTASDSSYGLRVAQRALPGFVRSLAKELRGGSTAQLLSVASGAESQLQSSLGFFLSPKSAYVNAQCIRIDNTDYPDTGETNLAGPLSGKVALVTGASRGIGYSIAKTLQRDGAKVICLDIPAAASQLQQVATEIDGLALALDVCSDDAGSQIVDFVQRNGGKLDCLIHNAGITRDKSLAAMPVAAWQSTLAVNLASPMRINSAILNAGLMQPGGRVVGVSSISGIAGNKGQSNYAASKAGVIGMVESGHLLANSEGVTFNCVAPGFIETEMTAKIPFFVRQAGRRMSSLNQGGLPVDVAETIAWMCQPASAGLQGNTVRVCGQNLLGA